MDEREHQLLRAPLVRELGPEVPEGLARLHERGGNLVVSVADGDL